MTPALLPRLRAMLTADPTRYECCLSLAEVREIVGALEEADGERNQAKGALAVVYALVCEILIHHEALMLVWRDKARPDTIKTIEDLRLRLFLAAPSVKAVLREDWDDLQKLLPPLGEAQ